MAEHSRIEWTEATWNPVTGCTKISPGCRHCYAERMAERLQAMGQANYRNGFKLTLQPQMLELPLRWKTTWYSTFVVGAPMVMAKAPVVRLRVPEQPPPTTPALLTVKEPLSSIKPVTLALSMFSTLIAPE